MLKKILLIITIVLLLKYSASIDQVISSLPYDSNTTSFYGDNHLWSRAIYYSINYITALIIVITFILLIFKLKLAHQDSRKIAISVLLSLIIGPGLIVNTIFKNNWGRPRPYQVLRDGQEFLPFYIPQLGKSSANSFPSGHAAIGFFLGVPFLILNRRKAALLIGIGGGSIVGLVRILQGGHYLTDIFFSGIIVWLSAEIVIVLLHRRVNE